MLTRTDNSLKSLLKIYILSNVNKDPIVTGVKKDYLCAKKTLEGSR